MRRAFKDELYKQMTLDTDIVVISLDLGYGMFNEIRDNYSSRFFNVGASEQAGMDMAVGMALAGKKPFVYSITNFILYRPFETLRNYINYEEIPVRLVASGRDKDYDHDGISHWSEDAIKSLVEIMVTQNAPHFISLKR